MSMSTRNDLMEALTFIIATWPVLRGAVKAGASPPEATVSIASLRSPFSPTKKLCSAPGSFSLTELRYHRITPQHRTNHHCNCILVVSVPLKEKEMKGDALKNTLIRWMKCNPRRVSACERLARQGEGRGLVIEYIGIDKLAVSTSQEREVDHRLTSDSEGDGFRDDERDFSSTESSGLYTTHPATPCSRARTSEFACCIRLLLYAFRQCQCPTWRKRKSKCRNSIGRSAVVRRNGMRERSGCRVFLRHKVQVVLLARRGS